MIQITADRPRIAESASRNRLGIRSGSSTFGCGRSTGPRCSLNDAISSSALDKPSASAWCTFITKAMWPCSRPSTIDTCHRGRSRSSGGLAIVEITSASSLSPPGATAAARPDVVVDVEAWIVGPPWESEAPRCPHELPAEWLLVGDQASCSVTDPLVGDGRVGRRRVDHRHLDGVMVLNAALLGRESSRRRRSVVACP